MNELINKDNEWIIHFMSSLDSLLAALRIASAPTHPEKVRFSSSVHIKYYLLPCSSPPYNITISLKTPAVKQRAVAPIILPRNAQSTRRGIGAHSVLHLFIRLFLYTKTS